MKKIEQVSFFYKGRMVTVGNKDGEADKLIKNYDRVPEEKLREKEGVKFIFSQLEEIIKDNDQEFSNLEFTMEKNLFCMNVFHLVKLKELKEDDKNGLLYVYKQ